MSGEELKRKLADTGISLTKISGMLGKTPQQLNQALDAKDVKTGLVEDLCRVLNVDISFFYGSGDKIVAFENSTAFKGNGNNLCLDTEKYVNLLQKKDEQIDRLLGIIEKMK